MYCVSVEVTDPAREAEAARLRAELAEVQTAAPFALVYTDARLELRKLDEPELGPVYVDFVEGAVAHRRKFGGGRGEAGDGQELPGKS